MIIAGSLIVTMPNPQALHRVRAARLGIMWENVVHILYALSSGIAGTAPCLPKRPPQTTLFGETFVYVVKRPA